jgi:hypothetical protein
MPARQAALYLARPDKIARLKQFVPMIVTSRFSK